MQVQEIIPILKEISIFGGLEEKDLQEVVSVITIGMFKKGDFIFKQDTPATAIYVIFSGRVRIVFNLDSDPHTLAEFGVGGCFGETSMIGIQNHSGFAIALEDTKLMLLSSNALNTLFKKNPRVFALLILNIARESCRRLCEKNKSLISNRDHDKKKFV